jgi:hypothetical protein
VQRIGNVAGGLERAVKVDFRTTNLLDASMASIIVWDIETVPDLRGFAAANGHDGSSDDEIPPRRAG